MRQNFAAYINEHFKNKNLKFVHNLCQIICRIHDLDLSFFMDPAQTQRSIVHN